MSGNRHKTLHLMSLSGHVRSVISGKWWKAPTISSLYIPVSISIPLTSEEKKAPSCSIPKTYHDKGLEHIQKTSLFKQVKVMSWFDHHLFVHTHWPQTVESFMFQSFRRCSSLCPMFFIGPKSQVKGHQVAPMGSDPFPACQALEPFPAFQASCRGPGLLQR